MDSDSDSRRLGQDANEEAQVLRELLSVAIDLESSDQFAWLDAHAELSGEGMLASMEMLLSRISAAKRDDSIIVLRILQFLFRHIVHGCFDRTALGLLCAAERMIRDRVTQEPDTEVLAEMNRALAEFQSAMRARPF